MLDMEHFFDEHAAVVEATRSALPQINQAANLLISTLQDGDKVLVCGNGGSAADAQHFAAELSGRFETERRGLPGIALTTDSSAMTAIANDYGYDQVFARQVEALSQAGDVFVGISTSGNSANVVAAVEIAAQHGLKTIGLSGRAGGKLAELCDVCVTVPSNNTARIQECHILTIHGWCAAVDEAFS
jgi:D-sedoheptulose 7-phosphate isomerase